MCNKAQEPFCPATTAAASPSGSSSGSGHSRRINLLTICLLSSAPTASAYSLALPLTSSPSLPPLLPLIGRQHSSWRARGGGIANSLMAYRTFDAGASEAIGEPSVQSMNAVTSFASHCRMRFITSVAVSVAISPFAALESIGIEEAKEATGTSASAGSQFSMLPKRVTKSRPQPQPPSACSRLRKPPTPTLSVAPTPTQSITRATTAGEFRTSVLDETSALVAVNFVADWCALCKKTAPRYERWAAKERDCWKKNQQQRQREVKFVEVPLNKATSNLVVDALQIPTLPYVQLYHPVRGLIERGSVGRRNELAGFAKLVEKHSTAKRLS